MSDIENDEMTLLSEDKKTDHRFLVAVVFSGLTFVFAIIAWALFGNLAAYLAIVASFPAFVLGWRRDSWNVLRRSPALWASLSGFVLLAGAFLLQPGLPSVSSIGDFTPFALMPALALGIAPLGHAKFTLRHFALLCLTASIVAAVVGISSLMHGEIRATAPDFSPIHFATWAVTFGFMSLGLTLSGSSPWRWLSLAGPALGLLAALASGTRAALLIGCALALLYGVVWVQRRAIPLWFKLVIPFVLMGAVLLAIYLASLVGIDRPWNALKAIVGVMTGDLGQDSSTAYRVEMLRAGWRAFLDAPWVGHGWHQQLQAAMPYLSQMALDGYAAEQWGYIHNDALSLAVAAGIPGFLAYILFLMMPLMSAFSQRRAANWDVRLYLALSFTVGFFVSGMMDVLLMVEVSKVLLIFVAASFLFLETSEER